MANSELKIVHDVWDALDFTLEATRTGRTPGLITDSDEAYYTDLATKGDDYPLEGHYQEPFGVQENSVLVETPDDLEFAMWTLIVKAGIYVRGDVVEDYLQHEVAHGERMRAIGVPVVRYGIWVAGYNTPRKGWNANGFIDWQPFTIGEERPNAPTKLEVASVTAAPDDHLSGGDNTRLQQMGYPNAANVRRRLCHQAAR
jgi:hypothetical protein